VLIGEHRWEMPNKTRAWMERQVGAFLRLYGRRAQKGVEPNDRRYDPQVENYLTRLKPEDLDQLLHGDEDDRLRSR
jgi:hypothetical protein